MEPIKYEEGFLKSLEGLPHPIRVVRMLNKQHPDFKTLEAVEACPGAFHEHRKLVSCIGSDPPTIAGADMLYMIRSKPRIFVVAPELGELLKKTDIKGAELDMLHLPFPSIYLQMPPNEFKIGSHIPGDAWPMEGVYVMEEDLTTLNISKMLREYGGLPETLANMDLTACVEGALGNKFKLFFMIVIGKKDNVDDCISSMPVYFDNRKPLDEQFEHRVTSLLERKTGMEAENLRSAQDIFKWVFNCLLYINSADSDVRKEWLHKGLAEKVKKAKGPKKAKLRQALERDSAEIHHVGGSIRIGTPPATEPGEPGTGTRKRLHWVRGFWRNQACGPGFSQHKHKWIRPFLRGEGSEIVSKMYEMK
jgi:hypothetical protein